MKFLIVSFALAAVAAAQYQGYRDPALAATRQAAVLRQSSDSSPGDEIVHGIAASETGSSKAVGANGEPATVAEGGYQYTAPERRDIKVEWVAGPEGWRGARGAPPIPRAARANLRSVEYNAAHPGKPKTVYIQPGTHPDNKMPATCTHGAIACAEHFLSRL